VEKQQRTIRQAWEVFLAKGVKPAGVQPALVASWERSRASGVGVGRVSAPLVPEAELFRRRSVTVSLLTAARPALERSRLLLPDTASMMILSDADGLILDTAGDPRTLDHGRHNHLETGGRWEEGIIGTNAIGTALVERLPVEVSGAEHFCEDVQRWFCAATPIRHPLDGEVLGIVDISGPVANYNPQSLALAVSIGQEIETSLHGAAKAEHEILLRHFVSKRAIWLSEDILVIDRRGLVVHAAEQARRLLEGRKRDLTQELRRIVGSLGREAWEANFRQLFPNASVEIVDHEGQAMGCLIVVHRNRAKPAPPPRETQEPEVSFAQIVGGSLPMLDVRERARKLAASNLPILIEGETGVGKELFARAIKAAGPTAGGPFVPLNCGGMPRDLIASELFGYTKGAFTGADENGRVGKIEKADGGVLCLDEVGEMPLDLQSYLLRVLEDGIVYRVGDHVGRRVNVRIVSMTNRDLGAEIEAGRFRRDLYYRIARARLRIPPLRERGEDAIDLAQRFAAAAAAELGRPAPQFAPTLIARLRDYGWPGNVRELRNVVEAMVALAESDRLDESDLPPEIGAAKPPAAVLRGVEAVPRDAVSRADLRSAERATILAQVAACGGNLTKAAERLGIARSTLYLKLREYRDEKGPAD
jgi:sigma-54 dependent transcriptional regulator, acetoin dehydrogenase operon transcriptional activator AcoR